MDLHSIFALHIFLGLLHSMLRDLEVELLVGLQSKQGSLGFTVLRFRIGAACI